MKNRVMCDNKNEHLFDSTKITELMKKNFISTNWKGI